MIVPKVAAMATVTPPHRFTQGQLLAMTGYTDATRRGFFRHGHIDGRFLYVDPDDFTPSETVDRRQARFRRGALEETLQARPMPNDWGLMIGLGPGFTAEGALLRW